MRQFSETMMKLAIGAMIGSAIALGLGLITGGVVGSVMAMASILQLAAFALIFVALLLYLVA